MSGHRDKPLAGDSFYCEACGSRSVAKVERIMDGWTCVGERLICALCKAPIGAESAEEEDAPDPLVRAEEEAARDRFSRLAALLDTEPEEAPRVDLGERGHFCKDCRHFFRHPFTTKCLLHERDVEPMQDCKDFTPRPKE